MRSRGVSTRCKSPWLNSAENSWIVISSRRISLLLTSAYGALVVCVRAINSCTSSASDSFGAICGTDRTTAKAKSTAPPSTNAASCGAFRPASILSDDAGSGGTRPPLFKVASDHHCLNVEMGDRAHDLVECHKIETRTSAGFDPLSRSDAFGEQDCRNAWDVRPVDLPGNHEDTDPFAPTVVPRAGEEHVKPALVGPERVEEEGQLEQ